MRKKKQESDNEQGYIVSYIYSVIAVTFSCLAVIFSIGLSNADYIVKVFSITVFVISINAMFYYLKRFILNYIEKSKE